MSTEQEKVFQQLQQKHQSIREHTIKINATIENAQENSRKLEEAAKKKFNESNLETLKEMAAKWDKENEDNLKKYADDLERASLQVQTKNEAIKNIQQSN